MVAMRQRNEREPLTGVTAFVVLAVGAVLVGGFIFIAGAVIFDVLGVR